MIGDCEQPTAPWCKGTLKDCCWIGCASGSCVLPFKYLYVCMCKGKEGVALSNLAGRLSGFGCSIVMLELALAAVQF